MNLTLDPSRDGIRLRLVQLAQLVELADAAAPPTAVQVQQPGRRVDQGADESQVPSPIHPSSLPTGAKSANAATTTPAS
jgi:hypothetical protein